VPLERMDPLARAGVSILRRCVGLFLSWLIEFATIGGAQSNRGVASERLRGGLLNIDLVQAAITEVTHRHDSLRTRSS